MAPLGRDVAAMKSSRCRRCRSMQSLGIPSGFLGLYDGLLDGLQNGPLERAHELTKDKTQDLGDVDGTWRKRPGDYGP